MASLDRETNNINAWIAKTAEQLAGMEQTRFGERIDRPGLKEQIAKLLLLIRSAMYPNVFGRKTYDVKFLPTLISQYLQQAVVMLYDMLGALMGEGQDIDGIIRAFVAEIPQITETLKTDIRAAYEGDPAARTEEEIMLSYPAFEAISIYRIAHSLHCLQVPLLPRMMTEYAHQITGIDIHPGATIGRYFFIDHGTGVVIGETCTIGDHVKLYQGVTLGAKSFELDENGNPVKGIKRHPDIGGHVVIYSGATILGGSTKIGDHAVIGGNVWLTHSVESGMTVYYTGRETAFSNQEEKNGMAED